VRLDASGFVISPLKAVTPPDVEDMRPMVGSSQNVFPNVR